MSVTFTAIGRADFSGRNRAGAISVPGLKAGDQIMFICGSSDGLAIGSSFFEPRISVDDEIQQNYDGDASTGNYTFLFFRAV